MISAKEARIRSLRLSDVNKELLKSIEKQILEASNDGDLKVILYIDIPDVVIKVLKNKGYTISKFFGQYTISWE